MPVDAKGFKGGDRTDIQLPAIQRRLVSELKKLGKPMVFVNYSGSAVALEPESEACDAMLQAWYPGQAGGEAVADVLLGDYNPSGKLPVTFYRSTEQLPDFEDYSMRGRTYRYMTEKPLFCFGHGLSYTQFTYGKAVLDRPSIGPKDRISLTVPVSNTGNCDGEEVLQVYLRRLNDADAPSHTLRAFRRIELKKGETRRITLELTPDNFEWFDPQSNTMRLRAGTYELLYGGTSDLSQLQKVAVEVTE